MKIVKQYRSIATHNGTTLDKTHKVGHVPQLDDVVPLTAYDDDGQVSAAVYVDMFYRFVDKQDGKPLTKWVQA